MDILNFLKIKLGYIFLFNRIFTKNIEFKNFYLIHKKYNLKFFIDLKETNNF
jgi:hypothetical protein